MDQKPSFETQLRGIVENIDVESRYGKLFMGLAPIEAIPAKYPEWLETEGAALIDRFQPLLPAIGNMAAHPYLMFFTMALLTQVPDYFWTVPASSTGKNHRPDENIEGGLVKHTARACAVGEHLLRAYNSSYGAIQKDLIRSAIILHDSFRSGDGENLFTRDGQLATDPMHMLHPRREFSKLSVSSLLIDSRVAKPWTRPLPGMENASPPIVMVPGSEFPSFGRIMDLIEGHYGPWSPSPKLNPEPGSAAQIVFLADYIASRGNILVEV